MADEKRLYTCARCGEECLTAWSEEEARAEYEANFGMRVEESDAVEICDDCYRLLTGELPWRSQ
jgi:hypothetical protein